MDDGGSGTRVDPREVHDFWPRLLASPILGALVANLSGLIDHTRHSTVSLTITAGRPKGLRYTIKRKPDLEQRSTDLPREHPWAPNPTGGLLLRVLTSVTEAS